MNVVWTRRRLLESAVATGAAVMVLPLASANANEGAATETPQPVERALELHNTHTGETVNVVYRRGEEYLPPAIESLRHVLRDHRNDTEHDIDPALYDQLHELALAAKCQPRYEIISGYRSPESNAAMAARPGSGVAKHSLHMDGRAIDIRVQGVELTRLRDAALGMRAGGVGYYEASDFIPVDTGRVRRW
jgi:uncharacterized protein YcbK (DUF882 family)